MFFTKRQLTALAGKILFLKQIFCVFPSAMELVLKNLAKFVTGNGGKGYISRQQMWLTSLVCTISRKLSYSSFCLDKRPHVFGAACYRSQVGKVSFVI